jgi:hypothetical protein
MTLARNPNTLNPDLFRQWRKHEKKHNRKKSLFLEENLHEKEGSKGDEREILSLR